MRHDWQTETVDSGHLGSNDFWHCPRCGAAGGPVFYEKHGPREKGTGWIFYADGSGLQLTDDCVESASLINQHFQRKVQGLVAEGYNRELAAKFEVATSTVARWASGVAVPLPRMKHLILNEIRRLLDDSSKR